MALFARDALLPTGWARDVLVEWDAAGSLTQVTPGAACPAGAQVAAGPLLPGMPNVHSHAFQHVMAGMAEFRSQSNDSFWSWRTLMYQTASRITPADLEAIATHLYLRMLWGGYTSVCEFHYLHNDLDGHAYADDATMSEALLRAARTTGIGITLLPVLYQNGGFGGAAPSAAQRRFVRTPQSILGLIAHLRTLAAPGNERIGFAAHSLRAVVPASLAAALAGVAAIDATMPIHIHIAEQAREVEECVAWSGQRPVAWLLANAHVDARWCLVHATHMSADEAQAAARSGAVAGLCPTTEANLGDGIFDAAGWQAAGGRWGLGSDSHACVDAAEELMMLEYSQRLALQRRNVLADARHAAVATAMTQTMVDGGAQASGRAVAGLAVGQRADFVVLDANRPSLAGLSAEQMLSAHVFASDRTSAIHDVYTAGVQRIRAGHHPAESDAAMRFVVVRRALLAA